MRGKQFILKTFIPSWDNGIKGGGNPITSPLEGISCEYGKVGTSPSYCQKPRESKIMRGMQRTCHTIRGVKEELGDSLTCRTGASNIQIL